MPKMYHPTLPNTYDGVTVSRHTFGVVWEPRGWRLIDEEVETDTAVDELIAAVAMAQQDDTEEEE